MKAPVEGERSDQDGERKDDAETVRLLRERGMLRWKREQMERRFAEEVLPIEREIKDLDEELAPYDEEFLAAFEKAAAQWPKRPKPAIPQSVAYEDDGRRRLTQATALRNHLIRWIDWWRRHVVEAKFYTDQNWREVGRKATDDDRRRRARWEALAQSRIDSLDETLNDLEEAMTGKTPVKLRRQIERILGAVVLDCLEQREVRQLREETEELLSEIAGRPLDFACVERDAREEIGDSSSTQKIVAERMVRVALEL